MDFGMIFKLQGLWMKFCKNHPKFPQFVKSIQKNGIKADSVIDIKITYPDGNNVECNLKITESDLQILNELKSIKK